MLTRPLIAGLAVVLVPVAGRAAAPDPVALAGRIDHHLTAGWGKAGATPAPPADDAAFARRVYLDLLGRIPTAAEARAFLAHADPAKRAALVARLLDAPAHHRHLAVFWRRAWLPQTDTPQFARLAEGFEEWVAARLAQRAPYDRLVRDMLTAGGRAGGPAGPPAAEAFYAANEAKPEELAASTARAFLGVNLDCAQCHDHPFARWTRDQFWQTAAFFARPAPAPGRPAPLLEVGIPNTKRVVAPHLLTGAAPRWPDPVGPDSGPAVLAAWVTGRDNPYFARNAVNRVWANLFGTGLVEPLDDLTEDNPASHPALLDDLAGAFAGSGYDLKYLTRAVVLSRAYQLSSAPPPAGAADDPRLFARAPVRGLTGEQLYDSLLVAAGLPPGRTDLDPAKGLRERAAFTARFRAERPATASRSIVQSLALQNGRLMSALTDPATTPVLMAVADAPFLDTRGKVEALFLAALGRPPTGREASGLAEYVGRGGADGDAGKALPDVFWALLNSSEFNTNH